MKIYIDWDREEWFTDETVFFKDLVEKGMLPTYSNYLTDRFNGAIEDLLELTDDEKIGLRESYEKYLKEKFGEEVEYGYLTYTVLEVEAKEGFAVKEIL